MAGDTLRGIGKKQIAEALEAAEAAARMTEPNGTAGGLHAVPDAEARPERSLDELPSERTGYPVNHSDVHATSSITNATTLVQTALEAALDAAAEVAPPTTTTTLVDDAAPLTSGNATPRSGPNRVSFGTMIGHEMHGVQARVAAAVAEADASGLRGTAHGRDVHLPAHPAMAVEPETASAATSSPSLGVPAPHTASTSSSASTPSADNFAPARDSLTEFSGGDHSFFDTAPLNDEYEPENPRGRLYTRLAVSGAVVAVVSVVVVAWINSHGNTTEEPPPIQVKAQPVAPAPAVAVTPPRPVAPPPRNPEVPPTSTIPSSMPERIAVSVPTPPPPPPRPAKAPPSLAPPAPKPAPVAAVAASAKPAVIAAPAPKPAPGAAPAPKPAPMAAAAAPVRELRTPPPAPQKKPTAVAAAAPRAPAPPPPHAAAPAPPPATRPAPPPVAKAPRPEAAPARPVAKASPPARSKAPARGKQKYDPDGTLPLSFE